MPEKPIHDAGTTAPATATVKTRKCRSCQRQITSALIHGECADCAGLVPLPLRGAGGRFLSFDAKPGKSGGDL